MSRPLRVVPCPARGWGAREGCGGRQVPPHTLSCPGGTELGDEVSPRMGSLDMHRKEDREGEHPSQIQCGATLRGLGWFSSCANSILWLFKKQQPPLRSAMYYLIGSSNNGVTPGCTGA